MCIKFLCPPVSFALSYGMWLFSCSAEDGGACREDDFVNGGVAFLSSSTGDCSLFEKVKQNLLVGNVTEPCELYE